MNPRMPSKLLAAAMAAGIALLGVLRFRKLTRRRNPAQAVSQDIKEIRDEL